jgi:hypothetical protein
VVVSVGVFEVYLQGELHDLVTHSQNEHRKCG